jgi:hypothetical protein
VIAAAIAAAALGAAAQDGRFDALDRVAGAWELDPAETAAESIGDYRCDADPLRIEISEDGRRYTSTQAETGVWTGPVLADLPNFPTGPAFLIEYDGEERLDPSGSPVQWLLVMQGEDAFYWIRRDWLARGGFPRTPLRRRCPEVPTS